MVLISEIASTGLWPLLKSNPCPFCLPDHIDPSSYGPLEPLLKSGGGVRSS